MTDAKSEIMNTNLLITCCSPKFKVISPYKIVYPGVVNQLLAAAKNCYLNA